MLAGGRGEHVGLLGRGRTLGRRQLGPLSRSADRAHAALAVAARAIAASEADLLLNHRLARRIVKAHSDWLDEVERELG